MGIILESQKHLKMHVNLAQCFSLKRSDFFITQLTFFLRSSKEQEHGECEARFDYAVLSIRHSLEVSKACPWVWVLQIRGNKSLCLRVWPPDQQHKYHLGSC